MNPGRLVWVAAGALLSCAGLRARELLPPSGRYQLLVVKADGTPLVGAQDFVVVREPGVAALVYLRMTDEIPPLCLATTERKVCEDVINGLHLAKAYVSDDRGVSALESEVVVADPLNVGARWVAAEAAGCQLVREVMVLEADSVVVEATSRCPGEPDEKKFSERWRRGLGLQEIVTADGMRTLISVATHSTRAP